MTSDYLIEAFRRKLGMRRIQLGGDSEGEVGVDIWIGKEGGGSNKHKILRRKVEESDHRSESLFTP